MYKVLKMNKSNYFIQHNYEIPGENEFRWDKSFKKSILIV